MLKAVKNFWNEEDGATAVEYGIMVAAIAAVIITVVISIGTKVDTAMAATMIPYSTAVAPSSSFQKFLIAFFIFLSFFDLFDVAIGRSDSS